MFPKRFHIQQVTRTFKDQVCEEGTDTKNITRQPTTKKKLFLIQEELNSPQPQTNRQNQNSPHLSSLKGTNCSFSPAIYFKPQFYKSSKTFAKLEINAYLTDTYPEV